MSFRIITDYNLIDKNAWESFVSSHPQGNIFQTPKLFDVFAKTRNHQPFVLAICSGNEIKGLLSGVIQKEYSGIIGDFTARSIIWGGPLLANNDSNALNDILVSYDVFIKGRAIYSQFRNLSDMTWAKSIYLNNGYLYEDHLNILIDLRQNEEKLWGMVHSKRRNEIRRASKEKTEFSIIEDKNMLAKAYEILKEVYKFAKLPFPDLSLFTNISLHSTENFGLRMFAASNQGKLIGVMFALIYENRIYDWYAGAYRDSFDKYPNDLIPWEVIRWGKAHGFEIFDFGGAGKPNIPYGVRDYKMKFGGELVNYGRFGKIIQPVKMKAAKAGFKIWQALKK